MQIFELHFNPNLKPDLIFDSFCYEPENIYEKRVGSLYLVGLLKNVLPQNVRFLEKLAKIIKERYYRLTLKNPEKALQESLKEANEFLEQVARKGDVRWLGNLNFATLSLKDYELNFTKVGEIKIFLLRGGRIIDIDQKLKFEEITPWPLRIFGNIVSGKLTDGDVILVSTSEVSNFFEKENLLAEIGKIQPFNEKGLKEAFDRKGKEILKISGICLAIVLTKENFLGKREIITPKLYPKEFNLKNIFTPILRFLAGWFSPLVNFFKKFRIPKLSRPKLTIPPRPKLVMPKLKLNKNKILILTLIFFLFFGSLFAQLKEKQKLEKYQITLNEIQKKLTQVESFLILKETKPELTEEANLLLKECWEEISPLIKEDFHLPKSFGDQVFSLSNEISENLYQLNKLEIIKEPELVFEFKLRESAPENLVIFNGNIFFFSPYAENLFRLDKELKGEIIEIDQKFNLAASLEGSVIFFSKSKNQLTILSDNGQISTALKEPYPDFNFDDISSFRENLYFLDKKSGQIIKYPYQENFQWGDPELWLKKAVSGESITADGSIWILAKNNSIEKYYAGELKEKIGLDIFPYLKDLTDIFASPYLPYLYILEPAQNRIIIITKTGQIIKQFQSPKFDNLLDFAVSEDGKTIYLLNGLNVYQILF